MAEHVWSVLCRRLLTHEPSNQISLLDVVEEVSLTVPQENLADVRDGSIQVPLPTELTFVSLLAREDPSEGEKRKIRMEIHAPDGEEIGGADLEADLTASRWTRLYITANHMPSQGEGVYRAVTKQQGDSGWEQVASIPFAVSFEPAPEGS